MTDLVSTRTRGRFRDLATDSRLAAIDRVFQDEGLAPNPDTPPIKIPARGAP